MCHETFPNAILGALRCIKKDLVCIVLNLRSLVPISSRRIHVYFGQNWTRWWKLKTSRNNIKALYQIERYLCKKFVNTEEPSKTGRYGRCLTHWGLPMSWSTLKNGRREGTMKFSGGLGLGEYWAFYRNCAKNICNICDWDDSQLH